MTIRHVPAYVDIERLCEECCISDRTVDAWMRQGILPPPRQRGGKRLWKWTEVERYLDEGNSLSPDQEADNVLRATKAALAQNQR